MRSTRTIFSVTLMATAAVATAAETSTLPSDFVDQVKMERLLVQFINARDSRNVDVLRRILAPDVQLLIKDKQGVDQVVEQGRDKQLEAAGRPDRLSPGKGPGEFGTLRHLCTNIEVEVRGSTATASCYAITTAFNQAADKPDILSIGRYAIDGVKRDGQWYVQKLRMVYDQSYTDLSKALQLGPYHPASDPLPPSLRQK